MKQYKILFLCHNLDGGGAEKICAELANGLAIRGHDVSILTDTKCHQGYATLPKVRLIPSAIIGKHAFAARWAIFRQFRHIFKHDRPDVVVSILHNFVIFAKIASIGMKIPLILSDHNAYERPKCAPFSWRARVDKFIVNRFMDCVTVLTSRDKAIFDRYHHNVALMTNPVFMQPTKNVTNIRRKVILASGRVDAWHYKGFDILIEAFSRISPKHPDWTIEIAGGGNAGSFDYLKSLARQHGIEDKVIFHGRCSNMQEIYHRSSVFCLSSRYEGFGLVLVEAMSQGCACVAADYLGRQKDIITRPEEGLTCEAEDVESLSAALDKMLSDDAYREGIRLSSVERSKQFSKEDYILRWENLLKNEI